MRKTLKISYDELGIFLFVLLALFPMFLLRDFTPSNELRYLSIADEAIRDGHLFAFYDHGVQYADKHAHGHLPKYCHLGVVVMWIVYWHGSRRAHGHVDDHVYRPCAPYLLPYGAQRWHNVATGFAVSPLCVLGSVTPCSRGPCSVSVCLPYRCGNVEGWATCSVSSSRSCLQDLSCFPSSVPR